MEDPIAHAKSEFARSKDRITKLLAETPDDKINWSPSPSARTPIQQVAHAAMAIKGIQGMLTGQMMNFSDIPAMDAQWREAEKAFTTREAVLALLEENSAAYLAFIDALTPEQVGSTLNLPMGAFPMAYAIMWPVEHTRSHVAQIEYIQTIYGDLNWHF